jgi:hypothetical protein
MDSRTPLPGLSLSQKVKEADPTRVVSLNLTETETFFLLSIPSTSVSIEAGEEATFVKAQNAKYKELKAIIPNNDNYVSRAMQTLQTSTKSKEIQATGNKIAHVEVNVSKWAIYDAFHEMEQVLAQEPTEGCEFRLTVEKKTYWTWRQSCMWGLGKLE